MALCDSSIYHFIADKYYDDLNRLSPLKRAAEIFRLETESLSLELRDTDEIFGWFIFDHKNGKESRSFSDMVPNKEMKKIMDAPALHGSVTTVDKGHTLVDYEFIIDNGLLAYRQKIEKKLLSAPDDEYLLAMKDVLESTEKLIARMLDATEQKIANCPNCPQTFLEIKAGLERVPFYPARNFREAIQAIWLIHFLLPLAETAWYSISLGKFDQYVYPYYKKSLDEGMTKSEAKKILYHFYQLLNSYSDGACLLNVGGNGYNELSDFIIACQSEFSMPAPILGARISENTPDSVWEMLIDERLFSAGQPTFYGENSCIHALIEKGVSLDRACTFSNSSCMGISLVSEEFNSMWGCVFSVSAVLESALNCGQLLHKDFIVPGIASVHNLKDLYVAFEKSAAYLFDICAKSYEAKAAFSEQYDPDPFVSLLTKGCIEKRCDRISGAKYHNVTVECMGMINAADGICVVDQLVFQDKKYSLGELTQAVKSNFDGYDQIYEDMMQCLKFGQNSEVDTYAVEVAEILQKVIRNKDNGNRVYSPSLHTLTANVLYGKKWGAGYDGRLAGTPFAKNAAASNCVRKKDPTSLALSAAKLPQYKFFGGQPIDINFSIDMIKYHKKAIAELIKVYLKKGGLQLQVNAMSSEILKDAVAHPEQHGDLVVRVGGYSAYFNDLAIQTKYEFIQRAEMEAR